MLGEMWISWKTSLAVVLTFLKIQALICENSTVVSGTEGHMLDFRCEYPIKQKNNSKYFCCFYTEESFAHLVRTSKHNEWTREGRVSLYDNTTAGVFIVRVDKLYLNDSGTYWCGADGNGDPSQRIFLNVSRENEIPASNTAELVHKLTLPLFLAMMLCIGAIMFVCLFTICLLLNAKKRRRSTPRQKRETSSDYETMMPTEGAAPEACCQCSCPDCVNRSALPRPPSDLLSCFTEEHQKSITSHSLGEYVDVDIPEHFCQYQHLDQSRQEEHIYHSLHRSIGPEKVPQTS